MRKNFNTITTGVLGLSIIAAGFISGVTILGQSTYFAFGVGGGVDDNRISGVFGFGGGVDDRKAPMATSGNNVYVTWWTNKSGDWEVMFKASADSGKTFGPTINLSNSLGIRSDNAEISASGNNVYVSWWERNQTSNEPVMRVSKDNGKTFGDTIELSNNTTLPK